MSRFLAALICATPLFSAPSAAQQVYGPADEAEIDDDAPLPPSASEPCETEVQEEGVILVCRELTDSERYMSPLPKPTQSDRVIMPGLNDPPCWVTNPGPGCIRFGYAPEPALMIDVTAFPEPLSDEEAELVSEVEDAPDDALPARGARIPIDLSED
ncbi:hypothetical protein [Erythrobacter alti]|uniref:hypothetical protein n=1 Tax=Erythrobacter alti TaxID=1896145 RepID=UPI0030F3CC87